MKYTLELTQDQVVLILAALTSHQEYVKGLEYGALCAPPGLAAEYRKRLDTIGELSFYLGQVVGEGLKGKE